ncbi:unnamed protein product [Victoria cruziana]
MRGRAGGRRPALAAAGGRRLTVLNVAEKPSVARSVASILSGIGNPPSREGRSRFNRVFEFEYNIRGQLCMMFMTSVTGHLMELDFDQRYRKWHSCDPSDLFSAPVQKFVPEDKLDIKRTLEEECRKCQWLVLWLDCDREGENIAYEVIEVCRAVNPHLNILRAHFSALINREIHEAAQNLGTPNPLFADAVDLRQEIDLRIGASFTRFQTMLLRNAFDLDFSGDNRNIILSYGPCQFPTLGFVVERFWEIQSHELEEFWTINCSHDSEDGSASFTWTQAVVQEQQCHPSWGLYAQRLLDPESGLWRNPGNGGHDDKAHPPIHPTKFSAGEASWSQDHNKLYELVVRHFLACVSQPAVGAGTTVEFDIAGESFTATGLMILAKNYLDVYSFETWGGSTIPMYQLGQQFLPTTLTLDSGVTRPPPLLSESDLLGCMDKAGIGTDATMHDHIKKLLDRYYAVKDSSTRFSPTNLGEALVMGYDEMGYELWKPYLRSAMESDMKSVSVGTKRKAEVLESCLQQMKACFVDARIQKGKLMEAMEIFFERSNRNNTDDNHAGIVRTCTVCQESEMVLRRKPDGNYMVGCLRFPLCRNVVWLPGSISEAHVSETICTTCTPGCIGGCDEILLELTETCGTGSRNFSAAPWRSEVLCDVCQTLCMLRTANTSNNRGRKFYTCQSRECNFFVWEDNLPNNHVDGASRHSNSSNRSQRDSRASRGRGRQRERNAGGSFVTVTGDPTERRCFLCGDPSHFANVCPNRG